MAIPASLLLLLALLGSTALADAGVVPQQVRGQPGPHRRLVKCPPGKQCRPGHARYPQTDGNLSPRGFEVIGPIGLVDLEPIEIIEPVEVIEPIEIVEPVEVIDPVHYVQPVEVISPVGVDVVHPVDAGVYITND
ncbi:uncharacterized protein LOC113207772 isoform X2 [Frankliniella occidentalis]|uniref:Uncharacterized protein LOC113207772 isoform X2 n=1 Tax=Frankliniella occidentalis TaxID=133901 RepID=A0A6J1SG97_FRAOC|nr:uncharacterized protein LOC113207772 isoform X2 [Frankliniella occidentalis]